MSVDYTFSTVVGVEIPMSWIYVTGENSLKNVTAAIPLAPRIEPGPDLTFPLSALVTTGWDGCRVVQTWDEMPTNWGDVPLAVGTIEQVATPDELVEFEALRVADAVAAKAAEKEAGPIRAAARAATARQRFIRCAAAGLGIEPEAVGE